MDFYKARLKKASWGWMETTRWHEGKELKDKRSGRAEKRGARQECRRMINEETNPSESKTRAL